MIAQVSDIPVHHLQRLRWLVGQLIVTMPIRRWRHTGLGALQAYVREGDEEELRVHVWHPGLQAPGIQQSGDVHDHRFDLESDVLDGVVRHTEYQLTQAYPSAGGGWYTSAWSKIGTYSVGGTRSVGESELWRVHEVTHARAALEATGSMHEAHPPDERRYVATVEGVDVREGQTYRFPRGEFHATKVVGPAVTLVRKLRQRSDVRARVLSPVHLPVVHAFENPLPADLWVHVLADAVERLLR